MYYLSEERELDMFLWDESTSAENMLDLVGLGTLVQLRAINTGGDYEVCVNIPQEEFPFQKSMFFRDFDTARSYIKSLYPETDWETTGW